MSHREPERIDSHEAPTAREILQETYDNLSSFLLDHVADGEFWEDAYPELDELRTHIGNLLASGEGLNS